MDRKALLTRFHTSDDETQGDDFFFTTNDGHPVAIKYVHFNSAPCIFFLTIATKKRGCPRKLHTKVEEQLAKFC